MVYEPPEKKPKEAVAERCHGYRNRTAALLGNMEFEEPVSCETCLRWHNGPCSIFDDVLSWIEES